MVGERWAVAELVRVVDGDTVRVVRSRTVRFDRLEQVTRDVGPDGISVRLAWVDTPERGKPDWFRALADLARWCDAAARPLQVVCFESAGWDRLLVDLVDAHGDSASQHMMGVHGWPPYLGRTAR